jgi:hypothetical protein
MRIGDMAVRMTQRRLGSLPWLVVRGPATEAFACLGRHLRTEIAEVVAGLPALDTLRRQVAAEPGARRFAAVCQTTQARFPGPWAELAALADGAQVPLADLALLNLRGDLGHAGPETTDDGTGCSDLAWRRDRAFIAHNEDETDFFAGRCALLTLELDDRPPVAVFAKAGFLPSNTFTVTGSGLVWSIDHLPAAVPGPGAGRHFVARGLQSSASTVDQAVDYLREHPSAGGFAYTIGGPDGRVVSVEASAGQHEWREIGADGPIGWHTNHGRYVAGADAGPNGTSRRRGQLLAALHAPDSEPEADWFVRVLDGAPPDGVRAVPSGTRRTTTLCTFVADLTGDKVTIVSRGSENVTVPLSSLTRTADPD